jgi:hypothetical protein
MKKLGDRNNQGRKVTNFSDRAILRKCLRRRMAWRSIAAIGEGDAEVVVLNGSCDADAESA